MRGFYHSPMSIVVTQKINTDYQNLCTLDAAAITIFYSIMHFTNDKKQQQIHRTRPLV